MEKMTFASKNGVFLDQRLSVQCFLPESSDCRQNDAFILRRLYLPFFLRVHDHFIKNVFVTNKLFHGKIRTFGIPVKN